MSSFDERYEKVLALTSALATNRDRMIEAAVFDLQFTVKDSAQEVKVARDRLKMYKEAQFLRDRVPLGGPGSRSCLLLSYNGSAWLNTAITSIYMVGNKVTVKFSSRGRRIMALTREMYEPVFGSDIGFFLGHGKDFIKAALKAPDVSAVVVFGFDENIMPYQEAFRRAGKKLVFEGPGQDAFIESARSVSRCQTLLAAEKGIHLVIHNIKSLESQGLCPNHHRSAGGTT